MKLKQLMVFIFLFLLSNLCYSAQLNPPVLIAPINGVEYISPVSQNFNWKPVTGATSYRIVVVELGHFKDFVDLDDQSYCSNNETCFTSKITTTSYSGFNLKPGLLYQWYLRAGSATVPHSTWASSEFVTASITLTFEGSNLQGSPGSFFITPNTPVNLSFKATGSVARIEIDWFGNGTAIQGDPASSGSVVTLTRSFPFQYGGQLVTWSATAYNTTKTIKSNMLQGSFFVVQQVGDCIKGASLTIPDGTVMAFGTSFTKKWRFTNCGTTVWNNYQLAYLDGDKLSTVLNIPIQNGLAPGQSTVVSVPMTTPNIQKFARYTGYWRVKNAANTYLPYLARIEVEVYVPASKPKSSGNTSRSISNSSGKNACPYVDPINSSTGSQEFTLNLLSVSGLRNIEFTAYYNSLVLSNSPIGYGWGHNYETHLRQLADGSIRISWRSNREDFYDAKGDGSYTPRTKEVAYDTLVKDADGRFLLTRKNKSQYFFNRKGLLIKDINPQGQQLTYTYNEAGMVDRVTERVSGVYLQFNYASVFRLASVSDPIGRKVEFSYDTDGRMIAYTDALGNKTSYTLNADGQLLSGINAEGIEFFHNTFDSDGRVVYQKTGRQLANDLFAIDYTGDVGNLTYPIIAKDHFGKKQTITYQDGYVIKEFVDELGNKTQLQYDEKNNPIKVIDAKGRAFERTFDSHGNITSVKDPLNQTVSMTYDGNDNLLSRTDANGKTTRFTYDNKHNVLTVTDANNKVTQFTYTPAGKPATITTPEGNTTRYSYQNGHLSSITDPEHHTTRFTYDAAGRVVGITDAEGFTTTLLLDNLDRVIQITDALGNTTKKTYDSRGNILTITDPNENTRSFAYDGNKNLISSTNALGGVTQYEYDANDRLIKIIDPKQTATRLKYDAKGRVVRVTDAFNRSVTYEYDKTDQLVKKLDPLSQETLYNYNDIDNLVSVTNALNQSTQFEYDKNSNVIAVTDPLKRKTLSRYDALNRLIESTDALEGKAGQTYSDDGNVTDITDPNINKTVFAYDRRGLLVEETSAAGISHKYSYNGRGLVNKIINGRGQVKTISFDQVGRPVKLVDPVGTIELTYDPNGNVLTVTDANGTITRTYDKLNRVTRYTNTAGESIGYEYDANSNVTVLTYPDGRKVRYRYDRLNRMERVTDWANRVTSYEYDENSRLVKTTRPNGSVETRSYNKLNQLVELKDVSRDKTVYQVNYAYDEVGNITKEDKIPDKMVKMPVSNTLGYRAGNQLSVFAGKSPEFDGDGNMTKAPFKGAPYNLSFNARNQLVTVSSGQKTKYYYDAEGYRTHQVINNSTIRYTVNPEAVLSQVLVETRGPNKTYYVYGLGLIGEETHKTYLSYHFDYRGSTVARTNIQGAEVDRYSYSPFGEVSYHSNSPRTPFVYNGRDGVMTDESGLYYMRARYYSPELHRFVSQDALIGGVARSSSLNRYGFVEGNPVSFIDPLGLSAAIPWGDVGKVFGGGVVIIVTLPEEVVIGGTALLGAGAGYLCGELINTKENRSNSSCQALWLNMESKVAELQFRYNDMLSDRYGLFFLARSTNPGGELTGKGTWNGHQKQYNQLRDQLKALVLEAKTRGCPIYPNSEYWMNKEPPTKPSNPGLPFYLKNIS